MIYNFEGYYENQKLKSNLFNKRYGSSSEFKQGKILPTLIEINSEVFDLVDGEIEKEEM